MITARRLSWILGLVVAASLPGGADAQAPEGRGERCELATPGQLVIHGEGVRTLRISHAELAELPRVNFRGQFSDGRPAIFEGVALWTLLRRAGVPDTLRSGDLVRSVVVEAADGYRALYSIAELSPAFRTEVPLLADRQEGRPIREGFGPVQVIVPGELRQSRWVRQVECLRIM